MVQATDPTASAQQPHHSLVLLDYHQSVAILDHAVAPVALLFLKIIARLPVLAAQLPEIILDLRGAAIAKVHVFIAALFHNLLCTFVVPLLAHPKLHYFHDALQHLQDWRVLFIGCPTEALPLLLLRLNSVDYVANILDCVLHHVGLHFLHPLLVNDFAVAHHRRHLSA